jgi:hypothetical protein
MLGGKLNNALVILGNGSQVLFGEVETVGNDF